MSLFYYQSYAASATNVWTQEYNADAWNALYNNTVTTTTGSTGCGTVGSANVFSHSDFARVAAALQATDSRPVPAANHALARKALLRAADAIEKQPGRFNFSSTEVPDDGPGDCTIGCALGWITAFIPMDKRISDRQDHYSGCMDVLGLRYPHEFYDRMNALVTGWRCYAPRCVKALRAYADKFHPAKTDAQLVNELVERVKAEPFVESSESPDKVIA